MNNFKFPATRFIVFLTAFLSLVAVSLSIWQAWSYYASRVERQSLIETSALEFAEALRASTNQYFSGIFSSLSIVSQSLELVSPESSLTFPDPSVEKLFTAFLKGSTDAYMIRYLDLSGQELLKIEKLSGIPQKTPNTALQYKGERDYFEQGIRANIGEFYISELDLNVENGKVEEPWRPTIRAAIPIDSDLDSIVDGLLVANIDINALFTVYASLETRENNFDTNNKLRVLNEEGYWLYGVERDNLWGSVFDTTRRVSIQYPQLWEYLESTEQDSLVPDDQSAWVYSKNKISTFFPIELEYGYPNQATWHFLIHATYLVEVNQLISNGLPILTLIVLILLSLGWSRSVEERRRVEKTLVNNEKLASLGSLVAGISHELNTPIGNAVTVSSSLTEISRDMRSEISSGSVNKSSIVNYVNDVEEASMLTLRSLNRAAELISDFNEISVDQMSIFRRKFELDIYIEHVTRTIAHLFRSGDKKLTLELSADVTMDSFPGPLSQVLINLIQNALLHGFEPDEAGKITVSTSMEGGDRVRISVADNGKGIPLDIIDRVFEPFFTTRRGTGGTGLGLHLTHNIVTDVLGGNITLTSNQADRETEFRIVIPIKAQEIPMEHTDYYKT